MVGKEKEKYSCNDSDFKQRLTLEQYEVLRKKGTERAFTGKLLHNKESGKYTCAACGQELFDSKTKFDSGTGWPSFFDTKKGAVDFEEDSTLGMKRIEAKCSKCGSHLGHVFNDGPKPTGKRYCINSLSLEFEKEKEKNRK